MTFDILLNPSSVVTPLRPIWYLFVQLSIPLGDTDIDAFQFAFAILFSFRVQIMLYNVFNPSTTRRKKRSIQQDQRELFGQIEDGLAAAGMDGHACVLRFICEMQTNRFTHSSIFGEVISLIFTPKPGGDMSVLREYVEAEMAGQGVDSGERDSNALPSPGLTCAQRYSSCPVSVFAALRRLHTRREHSIPEDRPYSVGSHTDEG